MPRDYYDDAKPALLELFDPRGLRILDAGCGGGRNGELAKRAGAREVVGVELDAAAAARARERLDLVLQGDLATFDPAVLGDEPFDAVLAVDVLEHMADPDAVLGRLVALVAPGGVVVASIPNVAHVWVIANLVMRRWPRNDSGIFDRTHLRFFAPRRDGGAVPGRGSDGRAAGALLHALPRPQDPVTCVVAVRVPRLRRPPVPAGRAQGRRVAGGYFFFNSYVTF